MQEKEMQIDELAQIINMKVYTLRSYLTNYRFNKFRSYIKKYNHKYLSYKVNLDFANEMAEILFLRNKWGALKLWSNYCGKEYLMALKGKYENVEY